MTLMINVSPETARRLADDPEALRRAGELIDAEFGGGEDSEGSNLHEDYKLSPEDEALITDRLERIESGELKEAPWDSSARRKRTHELLKREFGWSRSSEATPEGGDATSTAEAA